MNKYRNVINRSNTLIMISVFIVFIVFLYSCKSFPPAARKGITIILTSIPQSLIEETGKLSDDGKRLLSEIESSNPKCNFTYILDPTIIRPDIDASYSIATKIDRSGIVATDKPQVIVKYLKQKLDTLVIPEVIIKKPVSKAIADSSYISYLSSKLSEDSLIVYSDKKGVDSIELNGKSYRVYSDVDVIRNKIQSIICQNPKASITLLINPPNSIPIITSLTSVSSVEKINSKDQKKIAGQGRQIIKTVSTAIIKDLIIIKGSEGCDLCTRYYSATDNLGRIHEVKEKNSTYCCPCGKTIEMKGKTYRMECGESGNRLALVE